MTPDEFRRLGHRLIDWVADYRERVETLPVMSRVQPGDVRAALPKQPPQTGGGLEAGLASLDSAIVPGITHWNHPGFFAYFPGNFDLSALLGDLVSGGLAPQGMSWQTSPAATELEEVVMDWLRQALGLPPTFTGVIHDTASTATFCALLCAREHASHHSQQRAGLHGEPHAFVVYASDQAHSSIEKGTLLAGYGRENLRLIGTDENHALRLDLLEAAIDADLAAGRKPAAIVAAIGTTATTAIDPLLQIAALARRRGIWLHVDAAMAGTAMLCPEKRWMWEGVEHADSLVMNPHKWMGAGLDLSAYFVRDVQHLIRVMSTNPSYLRTVQDGLVTNFRDWGLPLGRRMRSLRLWFLMLDQGVDGLAARVRRDLAHAAWLKEQIDAAPDWERLAPVPLQTLCFRHVPAILRGDEPALAGHNLAIMTRINQEGCFYLSPAQLKGRQILRVSIGSAPTERRHVEALWTELKRQAREP